jgi:acyl-CoA thioester hydrolase
MNHTLTDLLDNHVLPEEIDQLGHLSVPFYEARAIEACRNLAESLGCRLSDYAARGIEFTLVDAYLRNLREQFVDAPLRVRGGVLSASPVQLQFYQELINTHTGELAATFIYQFELQHHESRARIAFEETLTQRAQEALIALPEHGRPRTIALERPPRELSLSDAQGMGLARTRLRTIEPDECDETGRYRPEHFTHLPYSGVAEDDLTLEWVFHTSAGQELGIADLESRNVLFSVPRAGDKIQVFNATVDMGSKVFQRAHWVYNLDTSDPISWATTVCLPLDLAARRSVAIPEEMRAAMAAHHRPDLS